MLLRMSLVSLRTLSAFIFLCLSLLASGCPDAVDADEDGFFAPVDPDDIQSDEDCNDDDAAINPGAADVCNGVDDDCDGTVDEGLDADGDGFFGASELCVNGADCDDNDASVNPGATEECDAIDHDCDGDPSNGLEAADFWLDDDGDGYGAGDVVPFCGEDAPEGHADNDLDCDDADEAVNPDGIEACNGVDDNCDDAIDEGYDVDEDGVSTCGPDGEPGTVDDDCDDADPLVNPDATEACNGFDDDCDGSAGADEVDDDADGSLACEDCDDDDVNNFPGNTEVCDGADNDCDGSAGADEGDVDGDGSLTCEDCDDDDDANFPGNPEICDGLDNDCDVATFFAGEDTDVDADGAATCLDCDDADDARFPGNPEICDELDNDCDGALPADELDGDTDGTIACEDCDDADGARFPGNLEICDGLDNDCDLDLPLDEVDGDADGFLACAECDDDNDATYPSAAEICDGDDNDCDGSVPVEESDGDGDGSPGCADCDDTNDAVSPDFPEACDGLDTDCSGAPAADEVDADGDFYLACDDYVDNGGDPSILGADDCEDADPAINPGATEVCDGDDENCDGAVDEGFDVDEDGVFTCGPDFVEGNFDDDCNDLDPLIFPGAIETCDGEDNDCDGDIDDDDTEFAGADFDEDGDPAVACGGFDCDDTDDLVNGLDVDLDGSSSCDGDCNDADPYVHPSAGEACDGTDTDCDGLVDEADPDYVADYDADGFEAELCGGTDCDDRDKHVFPEAVYTSGVEPQCAPVVYPGFRTEWHAARISLPSYFFDPVSENHYIYFRGHHTQEVQAIGVVEALTATPNDYGTPVASILEAAPGAWDHRNISNPTVAYVGDQGFARPYLMLYHARADSGGLRQIGLATAEVPTGPFERLAPDGVTALSAPVLAPAAVGFDNDRTLHPSLWYDTVNSVLHVWYNGRTAPHDGLLRIFHATSTDGGVTWTRTDDDTNGEADVIFSALDSAWVTGTTTQVNWVENPDVPGAFEFWYTGEETAIGYATATDATTWTSALDVPALDASGDCARFDGEVVTGRGIRYDDSLGEYHWYYGGQTDIGGVDCPGNEDDIYANGGETASYVAHGINTAPVPTANTPAAPATDMTFDGSVSDSAPDQVIITAVSDVDGFLGTAAMTPTGNSDPGVQSTTWSLVVTGLSSGAHSVEFVAVDEAGTARSTVLAVTVP